MTLTGAEPAVAFDAWLAALIQAGWSAPLPEGPLVAASVIGELPDRLRSAQRTF